MIVMLMVPAAAAAATGERVSVGSAGEQGDAVSGFGAAISADGRYVAFTSNATTLVSGDANGVADIFVRDRVNGGVVRASTNAAGIEAAGGDSFVPAISADGRFVAFHSSAVNLVAADSNLVQDVFVKDMLTGAIERVSVSDGLAEANGVNANPAISADGRYVAFESGASNLVVGDTNGTTDVFVRDRGDLTTHRVSVGTFAVQANADTLSPAISADGRFVAFESSATNLVVGDTSIRDIFVRDRLRAMTENISRTDGGSGFDAASVQPSISADGRFVAFETLATNAVAGDANGVRDIVVRDRTLGTTERVSVGAASAEANGASFRASISADGRHVAFDSAATNLVPGDTNLQGDVFNRDRLAGITERLSTPAPPAIGEGDQQSLAAAVSADGRLVAFDSFATNLVPGDTNGLRDVFVAAITPPPPPPPPPVTPTPPVTPPDPPTPPVQAVRRLLFGPVTVVRLAAGARELRLRVRNQGTITERFAPAGARLTLRRGTRNLALLRAFSLAVPAGKTAVLRFRYTGRERGPLIAIAVVRASPAAVTGQQVPPTPAARTVRQGVRL